jgi:hypothetical protein
MTQNGSGQAGGGHQRHVIRLLLASPAMDVPGDSFAEYDRRVVLILW